MHIHKACGDDTAMKTYIRNILWFFLILLIVLLVVCAVQYSYQNSNKNIYLSGLIISSIFIFIILRTFRDSRKNKVQQHLQELQTVTETSDLVLNLPGFPTRFSYQDLLSITEKFSKKLGKGGSGSVYLGKLSDGTSVAVKRLERESNSSHDEFYSEVATISRIRHVNLVSLKGFCAENGYRMLVYEYMSNGSLEKWIFDSPSVNLTWNMRFEIALGTARALAYLHEECEERVLHLDVKPQNILLDDKFRVKVSDFGLSRGMSLEESRIITTMRGTPGYLAPEWLSAQGIDHKTDVYSYGIMLLELVCGRRCVIQTVGQCQGGDYSSTDWFLPNVAFKKLEMSLVMEIVDPCLVGKMSDKGKLDVETMVSIALWCIQEDPRMRPMMSHVVQMLQGNAKVPKPPFSIPFTSRNPRPDLWNAIGSTTLCVEEDQSLAFPK